MVLFQESRAERDRFLTHFRKIDEFGLVLQRPNDVPPVVAIRAEAQDRRSRISRLIGLIGLNGIRFIS